MRILRGASRAWVRDVGGAREAFAILYWHPFLDWRARPILCKFGHHAPKEDGWYNADACAYEERWLECERCGLWMGHIEYHGRPVRSK